MKLKGKIALITGGAKGIGAATARRLAKAGAIVWVADVDDAAGRELERSLGAPHRYLHLDVTDEAAWGALVTDMQADVDVVAGIDQVVRGQIQLFSEAKVLTGRLICFGVHE